MIPIALAADDWSKQDIISRESSMHKKGTQWIVIMIDSTVIRTVHQVLQTCSDIFPIPKTLREVCTKSSGRLSYIPSNRSIDGTEP